MVSTLTLGVLVTGGCILCCILLSSLQLTPVSVTENMSNTKEQRQYKRTNNINKKEEPEDVMRQRRRWRHRFLQLKVDKSDKIKPKQVKSSTQPLGTGNSNNPKDADKTSSSEPPLNKAEVCPSNNPTSLTHYHFRLEIETSENVSCSESEIRQINDYIVKVVDGFMYSDEILGIVELHTTCSAPKQTTEPIVSVNNTAAQSSSRFLEDSAVSTRRPDFVYRGAGLCLFCFKDDEDARRRALMTVPPKKKDKKKGGTPATINQRKVNRITSGTVTVAILTDDDPLEISYRIWNRRTRKYVVNVLPGFFKNNNTLYEMNHELEPHGRYRFEAHDKARNGWQNGVYGWADIFRTMDDKLLGSIQGEKIRAVRRVFFRVKRRDRKNRQQRRQRRQQRQRQRQKCRKMGMRLQCTRKRTNNNKKGKRWKRTCGCVRRRKRTEENQIFKDEVIPTLETKLPGALKATGLGNFFQDPESCLFGVEVSSFFFIKRNDTEIFCKP